jgi:hypothetical protein
LAAVAELAQASETNSVNGSFNVAVIAAATALDAMTARLLWELIDDSQTANWQNINASQSTTWTNVDTDQDPGWTDIPTIN